MRVNNPAATSYTLIDLAVYTQYLISIQATNPEGEGPDTIVVVMTDEGAPSGPRNFKILSIQANSLQIWCRSGKNQSHGFHLSIQYKTCQLSFQNKF